MEAPFVRSAYNYDREEASVDAGLLCQDATLTQQSMADETDINVIVRRFGVTGHLPVGLRAPSYLDYEGVFDFHSAMNAIALAHESFDAMPGEIRSRFHNSPQEFLEFVSDEKNRAEAEGLGLVVRPAPVPVEGASGGREAIEGASPTSGAAPPAAPAGSVSP